MTTVRYNTFVTPLGAFSAGVSREGALVATAFGDRDALRLRLREEVHELVHDPDALQNFGQQLARYFADSSIAFDIPLNPLGSAFQQRVWSRLRTIPVGQTTTYGALADELKSSARAVGRANATNPICLVVPCHRVIGADGSWTGFAFGSEIKRGLLRHEGVRLELW